MFNRLSGSGSVYFQSVEDFAQRHFSRETFAEQED